MKRRVFIVEDEAIVAMELKDHLTGFGYEVCGHAARGDAALRQIPATRPDLVLMDVKLAGSVSGIEVAEALREIIDVPVIFVTAYADAELTRRAGQTGSFAYVVKPFEPRVLAANIELALVRQDAIVALRESELRFKRVIDHISDAIVVDDLEGRITFANDQFLRLFGIPRSELGQVRLEDYVAPSSRAAHRQRHDQSIERQLVTEQFEYEGVSRDGTTRWIQATVVPVRGVDGRVVGTQSALRDVTASKAAELSLRKSEELLAESQRIAHIGSWSLDIGTGTLAWTDENYRIHGLGRERYFPSFDGLVELAHADDRAGLCSWVDKAIAGEHPGPLEVRTLHSSGATSRVRLHCELVSAPGGLSRTLTGTTQDITKEWQKDAALRVLSTGLSRLTGPTFYTATAANLAAIVGCAAAFVGVLQPSGKAYRTLAYVVDGEERTESEYALIGTPSRGVADGRFRVYSSHVQRLFRADEELSALAAEAYAAAPLLDSRGNVMGLLGVISRTPIIDVEPVETVLKLFALRVAAELERERAEQDRRRLHGELLAREETMRRASESHLGFVLKHTPAIIYTRSAIEPCAMTFVSPNVEDALGFAPAAFVRDPTFWAGRVHPADLCSARQTLFEADDGGERACEYRFLTAAGEFRWIRDQIRTIPLENGAGLEQVGYWADITERKELEARLTTTAEQALESNRMKSAFLANMSHELRTPMNAVLGLSDSLLEGVYGTLTPKQERSLRTIRSSGKHLLALINDVLDVARIEAGKLSIELSEVALRPIIGECLAYVIETASTRRQRLIAEYHHGACLALADASRLKQMLINLLTNAIKYAPEEASITIGTRSIDALGVVEIWVSDTGPGIEETDRERIFEPFVMLDESLARGGSGAGLGLALVKRIAELHGGTIRVESETGVGSTFTLRLPRADGRASDSGFGFEPSGLRSGLGHQAVVNSGPAILLVEDNEANVATVAGYLEEFGFAVRVVGNAMAAFDCLRHEEVALILMDIQLPGMDGLEAISRIREMDSGTEVPIIALTAYAMTGDSDKCLAAGANAYLSKPVKLTELVRTINDLIRTRQGADV